MKIKWNTTDTVYKVTDADYGKVDLTVVAMPGSHDIGHIHYGYCTRSALESWIQKGSVVIVEEKPEPLALKVEVDASPLEKALATAKELEATLLRIKALL